MLLNRSPLKRVNIKENNILLKQIYNCYFLKIQHAPVKSLSNSIQ